MPQIDSLIRNMLPVTFGAVLGVAACLPVPVRAQQDEKADRYLQAVSGQFDLNESYLIHMDYIREDIMRETSAEGKAIIWMKGLKYKITLDEYSVYFDGMKQYSHNTDAGEVYVSTPDPDRPGYLQAVPIKIIKSYQQDFRYEYAGIHPFMGQDCVEIRLYPKELSGPYSMLKMFIQPGTLNLEGMQLKHKEGIVYTMHLTKKAGNQQVPDSTFTFDPEAHPETEVIELLE